MTSDRATLLNPPAQSPSMEAARDATRAELEDWPAGGPLARAVRAFLYRRGRG